MFKRLAAFFLLLAVSGGIASGMPLHAGERNMRMMACCKKSKMKAHEPAAQMARLCCAIHCANSAPVAPVIAPNFTPPTIIITDSVFRQIALLLNRRPSFTASPGVSSTIKPKPPKSPPKYIQHHSFLI